MSVDDATVPMTISAFSAFMRSTFTTPPLKPANAIDGSIPSCVKISLHEPTPSIMCTAFPTFPPHYGQKKGGAQRMLWLILQGRPEDGSSGACGKSFNLRNGSRIRYASRAFLWLTFQAHCCLW